MGGQARKVSPLPTAAIEGVSWAARTRRKVADVDGPASLVVGRSGGSGGGSSGRTVVASHLGRVHTAEALLAASEASLTASTLRAWRTRSVRATRGSKAELEKLRLLLLLHDADLLLHQLSLLLRADRHVLLLRVHVLRRVRRETLRDEMCRRRAEAGHLKSRREAVPVQARWRRGGDVRVLLCLRRWHEERGRAGEPGLQVVRWRRDGSRRVV